MPSVGSITKTIRLNPQDKEYVEAIMRENNLTWSGAIHYLIGLKDTPDEVKEYRQDMMDRAVEREIKARCKESNISTHDFYRGVLKLWKDGKLGIDGWKVRSLGNYKMERFVELCYILGTTPQKVIDKITKDLEVAYQKWLNQ